MSGGSASPSPVKRLKQRREFLAVAATGRRWVTPAFVLQAGPRPAETDQEAERPAIGLGFTASRRVGGAVERNRARRRLVEAARKLLPDAAEPGYNYVIIARPVVLTCVFDRLLSDLTTAFSRVTRRGRRPKPKAGAGRPGS
ncbi:MAG: ribonuclease P protein component [Pseudomonadota bacterium]